MKLKAPKTTPINYVFLAGGILLGVLFPEKTYEFFRYILYVTFILFICFVLIPAWGIQFNAPNDFKPSNQKRLLNFVCIAGIQLSWLLLSLWFFSNLNYQITLNERAPNIDGVDLLAVCQNYPFSLIALLLIVPCLVGCALNMTQFLFSRPATISDTLFKNYDKQPFYFLWHMFFTILATGRVYLLLSISVVGIMAFVQSMTELYQMRSVYEFGLLFMVAIAMLFIVVRKSTFELIGTMLRLKLGFGSIFSMINLIAGFGTFILFLMLSQAGEGFSYTAIETGYNPIDLVTSQQSTIRFEALVMGWFICGTMVLFPVFARLAKGQVLWQYCLSSVVIPVFVGLAFTNEGAILRLTEMVDWLTTPIVQFWSVWVTWGAISLIYLKVNTLSKWSYDCMSTGTQKKDRSLFPTLKYFQMMIYMMLLGYLLYSWFIIQALAVSGILYGMLTVFLVTLKAGWEYRQYNKSLSFTKPAYIANNE